MNKDKRRLSETTLMRQKVAREDPNVIKKKSDAQTRLWQDPVYKESQSKKDEKTKIRTRKIKH